MNRFLVAAALSGALLTTGCVTTTRETNPTQTAREQLLLSKAADGATLKIQPELPQGTRIFVDASNFGADADTGGEYNKSYAVSAVVSQLLRQGYAIAPSADQADTIALIRSGALSINKQEQLVGIPSFPIPIPFSGPVNTPEIAFYKTLKRNGIAKLGVDFYSAKTGTLQAAEGPLYGFSHYNANSLLFYGWTHSNLLPATAEKQMKDAEKTDAR